MKSIGLIYLFCFGNPFTVMTQDIMKFDDYGINNISVNSKLSNIKEFQPLANFRKQQKYFFDVDSGFVYFLQPSSKLNDFKDVDDLFVITDSENNIKMINVFFACSSEKIKSLLTKKFGAVKAIMGSSIANNQLRERYIWISAVGTEFLLKIDFSTYSTSVANLLIYPKDLDSNLGEWYISRL